MIPREAVQFYLDNNRQNWGKTSHSDNRDLWKTPTDQVTQNDTLQAGMRHSCFVIAKVSALKSPIEMWRSYNGKNYAFENIPTIFTSTNRQDLMKDWYQSEMRRPSEKTHPEVKESAQYPDGYNRRLLTPNSRMSQYYLSDHFKTLDHIAHGSFPPYSNNSIDQDKFLVDILDYTDCAKKAKNLDHFTALVAVKSAQILKSRGIDNHTIASILALNFAQTGTIRENGQQKHAQQIVDSIIKEITEAGDLKGLSSEFRKLARPRVQTSYFGKRNPRL